MTQRVLRFCITLPVRVRGDNAGKPHPLVSLNQYASPQARMGRARPSRRATTPEGVLDPTGEHDDGQQF